MTDGPFCCDFRVDFRRISYLAPGNKPINPRQKISFIREKNDTLVVFALDVFKV